MPSSTNSIGNLEVTDASLDPNLAFKLNDRMRRIGDALGKLQKTGSAGGVGVSQIVIAVPGILGIQSNVGPSLTLAAEQSFSTAVLLLKQPPIGGSVTVQLYVGGAAWGGVLSTSGTQASIDVSAAGAIAANALIRLDVTGVGTGSFPGSDLTVLIR